MNPNEPITLIAARCKRCYRLVAQYATNRKGSQWWRFVRVESRGGRLAQRILCTRRVQNPRMVGHTVTAAAACSWLSRRVPARMTQLPF